MTRLSSADGAGMAFAVAIAHPDNGVRAWSLLAAVALGARFYWRWWR